MMPNKAKETAIQQMIEFPPDDNSGSSSSNRFAYQKNWALYKMLELEQLGRDYMIVMDYHEDVVIIDASIEDNNIDFYQVKTKKGDYWRPTDLLASGNADLLVSVTADMLDSGTAHLLSSVTAPLLYAFSRIVPAVTLQG